MRDPKDYAEQINVVCVEPQPPFQINTHVEVILQVIVNERIETL